MNFIALSTAVFSLSAVTLFTSTSNLINQQDLAPLPKANTKTVNGYGHQSGVVESMPMLDSKTWVIQTADGRCFDPVNLPDSLKVEDLRINFSYKAAADWGYIYACGEIIELTQVARVK